MFTSVLDKITGLLEGRFTLTYLFPTGGALAATLLVFWLATGHSIKQLTNAWTDGGLGLQVLYSVAFLLAALVLALLLSSNATQVIRLFEGYWGPANVFQSWFTRYHDARRDSMSLDVAYLLYPDKSYPVVRTSLGNILRAAEVHPERLYGLNATIVWPRLYRLLPDSFITDLGAARHRMELPMVVSLWSWVLFLAFSFGLPITSHLDVRLYVLSVVATLGVAIISYRSAVGAAIGYGELVKAAFDLHRMKVLAALSVETPRLPSEERALWRRVNYAWYRGGELPVRH